MTAQEQIDQRTETLLEINRTLTQTLRNLVRWNDMILLIRERSGLANPLLELDMEDAKDLLELLDNYKEKQ